MTATVAGLCGLLGLIVGSFLNVVIYRVPRQESIVTPRSHCPGCATVLAQRDNIPVVSWLLLRGQCRTCGQKISPRYLLVELACGVLFAGAGLRFGLGWSLPAFLVLLAGLLALACTDLEHYLLPKRIVYPVLCSVGGLLLLAATATGRWRYLVVAVACAAAWFVVFFTINFLDARLLAFGDVRLVPVIGLGLGWLGVRYVVFGFFAANLLGALIGVGLIAAKRIERKSRVPYGVFLALGTYVAIFTGSLIPHHISGF